jgi:5-methylcytosine-specific restriction endonuclease McrA
MSYDTLVLNADASPLTVVPLSTLSWEETIKLVYVQHATVLHYYEDWVVRSPSVALSVPSVIILREYVRASKAVKYNRANILLRDLYRCMYCNEEFSPKDLTLDHYIPRAEHGTTKFENILSACGPCNMEKAHHHDMRPTRLPYRPTYFELVEKRKRFPTAVSHESWVPYLGWDENKIIIRHRHK